MSLQPIAAKFGNSHQNIQDGGGKICVFVFCVFTTGFTVFSSVCTVSVCALTRLCIKLYYHVLSLHVRSGDIGGVK